MKEDISKEIEEYRYERKFITEVLDKKELELLIKQNPSMFSEVFYERQVNNIYFDSLDLKNYYENIAGNSQRLKIRIRWYGEMFGVIKEPILELKIKNNELGRKMSFPLKPFLFEENFSLYSLRKVFSQSRIPRWLEESLKLYFPTLLNSYSRRYFISADKKYRITLDYNQNFWRIKKDNNKFNEKVSKGHLYVIEVKCFAKDYKKIPFITNDFPLRLTANSKYVFGIDLLEVS